MANIMIQGTTSSAGKSLYVQAFVRYLKKMAIRFIHLSLKICLQNIIQLKKDTRLVLPRLYRQ